MKALILTALLLFSWIPSASGDFVLTLKNGRRITVQNYREEGSVVKFYGMGGEIGISKDQIQSIHKAGIEDQSGLNLPGTGQTASSPPLKSAPGQVTPPQPLEGKPLSPEEQRAKEEREYQQSLRDVTQQIQELRDRYSNMTRGTATKDPTLLSNEEQLKARIDDLTARQKDAQQNPADPGVLRLLTPSPFSSQPPTTTELRPSTPVDATFSTPPPTYTDRQQQLIDLRGQAIQLEKERERLIKEMKQKNFGTGSLFLE